MIKEKYIPHLTIFSVLSAFLIAYTLLSKATEDRFTGARGAVLESSVESIKYEVEKMSEQQENAWARIECRQMVFITSTNKMNEDFTNKLDRCEKEKQDE